MARLADQWPVPSESSAECVPVGSAAQNVDLTSPDTPISGVS